MKLDYDFRFHDLAGEVSPEAGHAGELLSLLLAGDQKKKDQAVRFMGWAMRLHNKEVLDLDKADQKILRDFINEVDGVSALIRSQLEAPLDAKEEEDAPKGKSK